MARPPGTSSIWRSEIDLNDRGWSLSGIFLGLAVIGWVSYAALLLRGPIERCFEGLEPHGARCCAPGQTERTGHCVGPVRTCPNIMSSTRHSGGTEGCVVRPRRIPHPTGVLHIGPTDWDHITPTEVISVSAFTLDAFEVTWHEYDKCIQARACPRLQSEEPGQPVRGISPSDAALFCAFSGGRLPSRNEWVYAAGSAEGLRFPWGSNGLVCRRAAFGLVDGPCGVGGTGPELVGARPQGRSKLGVYDLAGNVAEWATSGDSFFVMGGSYVSKSAAALKSWSALPNAPSETIGFRCAYDRTAEPTEHIERQRTSWSR